MMRSRAGVTFEPKGLMTILAQKALVLVARQIFVQVISVAAGVILARLLSPVDFGLYALIGLFRQFVTIVSDGGLASGLIQQREEPSRALQRAMFTVLQVVYGSVFVIAIPASLLFHHVYPSVQVPMLLVMALTVYLISFRSLPAIQMERNLEYGALSVIEGVESLTYQIVCVWLAYRGDGVWSFLFANLSSRVVGVVLVTGWTRLVLWPTVHLRVLRSVLRFGASMQLNSIFIFLRDSLSSVFIGLTLGTPAVGYLNFALKVSNYPTIPMQVLNRMMFPVFSRSNADRVQFSHVLDRTIKWYTVLYYGGMTLLLGYLPAFIRVVFTAKWLGTLDIVYILLLGNVASNILTPLLAAINSLGHNRVNVVITMIELVLMWSLGYPLVHFFGLTGFAYLQAMSLLSAVILCIWARKFVTVAYVRAVWAPLLAMGIVVGLEAWFAALWPIVHWAHLAVDFVLGGTAYCGLLVVVDADVRRQAGIGIRSLRHRLTRRKAAADDVAEVQL